MKRLCASVLTSAIVLSSQMSWAADTIWRRWSRPLKRRRSQQRRHAGQLGQLERHWQDLLSKYGLKHVDTDMSSAQEIAKFDAEKNNATADIGDVGAAFGPVAVQKGVTQPYKPSTRIRCRTGRKTKTATGRWLTPAPSPSSSINSR